VNYEVRVAAFLAVKMLSGKQCSVWDGINGAELSAITMQAPEPVDDIVVSLRGDTEACVFISAKERSATIPLTNNSPAFTDTVAGQETECLKALLEVLDLFVEAGWPEARQLTHRLEEIYR